MLDSFREHLTGWPVRIMLGLLIVAFAIWGIGDVLRGGFGGDAVVTVGDQEISSVQLRRAFDEDYRRLQEQAGGAIDRRQAVQLGVMQQSLQGLVAQRLVDAHAAELGITVSDETLGARVRDIPAFRSDTGFDRERVALMARSLGLTEDQYLEDMRAEMVRREMVRGIADPVVAPAVLARQLWLYDNETRAGRALVVRFDAMSVAEPDDATLQAYLEQTKDRWQAPERRDVSVLLLRPADLAAEVEVSEDQVRAEYDARIAEFQAPEKRVVEQLLATSEDVAKEAATLLAAGQAMPDVARQLAAKGVTTEKLGAMARDQLPPELGDAIFAMAAEQYSAPVKSAFGWHIFRLDEVVPPATIPFEAKRAELEQELRLHGATDRLPDLANKLEDAIAGGASLEDAAATVGASVQKVTGTDSQGRGADGMAIVADGIGPEVLQKAFAATQNEVPSLGETPDGGYFMVRVDAIQPAATRPLEEVRSELAAAWQQDERQKAADAKAKELLARAQAGETLESLQAATAESELRPVPATRRQGRGVEDPFVAATELLFATEPGKVGAEVATLADGIAVVALDTVDRPEPPTDLAAAQRDLARALRSDVLEQYQAALRLRFPPLINQNLFDATVRAEEG
ncbi:MAG: SurA N-terminal domain-containing protein [Geminicoccaceae bacterium]